MSDQTDSLYPSAASSGDLDAQAAEWLIARQGDAWNEALEQAWRQWCETSAAHAAAYAHAERLWAELAGFRQAPELLSGAGVPVPDARRAPAHRHGSQPPAARRGSTVRRHAWGGLAAVAFAAVALFGWNGGSMNAFRADYITRVAETREVVLADGSRVQLGAGSAIAVRFSATERRLELLEGEALFEAMPVRNDVPDGERRPFIVAADHGQTRALGTRFVVERLASHTQVTGVEHQVAVALDSGSEGAAQTVKAERVVLSPGQAVRYDEAGMGAVQPASIEQATAWRRGVLVFDNAPLSDAVERINRYHRGWIVVRDEALARRRVSGVFPVDDVAGSVQAVADELHARVLRVPGFTLLY